MVLAGDSPICFELNQKIYVVFEHYDPEVAILHQI